MSRRSLLEHGTPVRLVLDDEVTGIVDGYYFEDGAAWYCVDWCVEGYGTCILAERVREISPLHLLAAC